MFKQYQKEFQDNPSSIFDENVLTEKQGYNIWKLAHRSDSYGYKDYVNDLKSENIFTGFYIMIEITIEYLKRFPIGLQECLKDERARKQFSEDVEENYKSVLVYRGVHSGTIITKDDFLGNVETAEIYGIGVSEKNIKKYQYHSVSVNESLEMLKKSLRFPNSGSKIHGIALGYMKNEYGVADFKAGYKHHNWYLFDGANEIVFKEFKIIC